MYELRSQSHTELRDYKAVYVSKPDIRQCRVDVLELPCDHEPTITAQLQLGFL